MTVQLVASHLAKAYKKRKVIEDVSLNVNTGEVVGLLGPNGAGKTTCFYMIAGLIRADHGQILLNDKDITSLPIHQRAKMGLSYLPQEASVFRKLTVTQNIMAVLEQREDIKRAQRDDILEQLLADFHISHIRNNLGISLSGGERRRVEIARALAANPRFILLDEPFAGVDPISVIDIKQIIESLRQRGLGVLITDHNVRETLSACERAYIVSHGKIIANGNAEQILNNKQVREVYLGDDFKL
jgi:lipopolysaccharide export system ATP-binding protein